MPSGNLQNLCQSLSTEFLDITIFFYTYYMNIEYMSTLKQKMNKQQSTMHKACDLNPITFQNRQSNQQKKFQ